MITEDSLGLLLPLPKRVDRLPGTCPVGRAVRVAASGVSGRVERALEGWTTELAKSARAIEKGTGARRCKSSVNALTLSVRCGAARGPGNNHIQGYRLEIRPAGIDIFARTSVGCWYAVQTLKRLVFNQGGAVASIPCCVIEDWPDFDTRGVLLDITRGRVPTLARLKELVDRLALLKFNQLQVYIEHSFVFSFDQDICDEQSGLTPDEVRALDAYCRDRFIDLVPAVATLGHMGRVLSMPRYRHLAEVAPDRSWEELDWPARARGFTLDCANPESHGLVERIWSEILDAFSCSAVNICGDEPWDLGKGRNAGRWNDRERGEVYLGHIRRTHDVCASRGRRTMFWSDVVTKHPELFDEVQRDSTVLHWGYNDKADYLETARFIEAGLDTFVCPGTSGWKRIINSMDLAERNIKTFAREGGRCGARGLIVTDWGDHGHFNMPACSWHGLALGAALGWSADHATGAEFDEAFARTEWGLADGQLVGALRDAGAMGADCETWPMLWKPVARVFDEHTLPSVEAMDSFLESSHRVRALAQSAMESDAIRGQDVAELALACQFCELAARKLQLMRTLGEDSSGGLDRGRDVRQWADEIRSSADRYAELWRAGDKESGLPDILAAFDAAAADLVQTVSAWT